MAVPDAASLLVNRVTVYSPTKPKNARSVGESIMCVCVCVCVCVAITDTDRVLGFVRQCISCQSTQHLGDADLPKNLLNDNRLTTSPNHQSIIVIQYPSTKYESRMQRHTWVY
jgi:hypothetical protein